MKRWAIACLLALPACGSAALPSSEPDLARAIEVDAGAPLDASPVDASVVYPDLAHPPFDLARILPDLALPAGPRFLSEASPDVVAVADRDSAGGDTLLAYGPTGDATTVAYSATGFMSGLAWPNGLIAAHQRSGYTIWWPTIAGGPLQSGWVTASIDGLYLVVVDGAGNLVVGPRDALEALPAGCISPKFAPVTNHLYFRCGADLYRLGKDQPAASAVPVAPGIDRWWFSSDGTLVIVDTQPLSFASTALGSVDAVTLLGTASPDHDFVFFESVTPIPGRTLVEYVAHGASGSQARELDTSTNFVRVRGELDVSAWIPGSTHPWFGAASIPLAATSSWFAYERSGGIQEYPSPYDWVFPVCLDPIDGGNIYCGGSGEARAPALLPSGAALFGAYVPPGVHNWTLVGPDLVVRASTMSPHGARAVPLDDDHFLILDAEAGSSGPLQTCGAGGCVDTLANPLVDDFRLDATTRRLYYIQNGAVLTTTL